MKSLGWCFLLTTSLFAQELIEPAPLSLEDRGVREIQVNQSGTKAVKADANKKIIPLEEVEAKAESLETIGEATKKELTSNPPALDDVLESTPANAPTAKKVVVEKKEEIAPVVQPIQTASEDGKLVLKSSNDQKNEIKKEAAVKTPATSSEDGSLSKKFFSEYAALDFSQWKEKRSRYLQISFGYLNSKYEKIHPSLNNGSMITNIRFVGDLNQNAQTGMSVEIISDRSKQDMPDSVRAIMYRLFLDYHRPINHSLGLKQAMHWLFGASLSIGDYSVERRYVNAQGAEVSTNLKKGTMIGLIPNAGIRFYLVGKTSLDLVGEYHLYFGGTQSKIGGLALSPRLSFEF